MKAVAVNRFKEKVWLVDHPAPALEAEDQVLIKSIEVGICGTDREICMFDYGDPPGGADYLVIGHEAMGEVVEVGSRVENLKVGDLVVPSVRRPCPAPDCAPCTQDDSLQDFCSTGNFVERGIKQCHGFMTEAYVEHEKYLTYVRPELRHVAVLMEPLTIAVKGLKQAWAVQKRLPWVKHEIDGKPTGKGLKAVVIGAGPIGILGAMKLKEAGFNTFVYSRSKAPNPKADIVESIGVKYISSLEHSVDDLKEIVGSIDLVYEAVGVPSVAFEVLGALGMNGIYIFTGIPTFGPKIEIPGDVLMRNFVLMNQAMVGTVNADGGSFHEAIEDLAYFSDHWPDAINSIITERGTIDDYERFLLGKATGIKNVISFE